MESSDISFEERLTGARYERDAAQSQLDAAVRNVGMTRHYYGQDPHQELMGAIQRYVDATAHFRMLEILATEDFFVALARSAGALQNTQNTQV